MDDSNKLCEKYEEFFANEGMKLTMEKRKCIIKDIYI